MENELFAFSSKLEIKYIENIFEKYCDGLSDPL